MVNGVCCAASLFAQRSVRPAVAQAAYVFDDDEHFGRPDVSQVCGAMLVQQVVREFISIVQSDQRDGLLIRSLAWHTDDEGICDVRASSPWPDPDGLVNGL